MDPFLTWSRFAWKFGEMAVASAAVIGDRAGRLGLAGSVPGARERREIAVMGREKGEAAWAAAQAVGLRMLILNQQFAALAFNHMLSTSAALMAIAASRSPAESVMRQSRLVRDTMTRSAIATSRLFGSTARLAQRALKPVHARVSGNVRRLARVSR
jgi:hypothetical protein